jgi:hypothetical protein
VQKYDFFQKNPILMQEKCVTFYGVAHFLLQKQYLKVSKLINSAKYKIKSLTNNALLQH